MGSHPGGVGCLAVRGLMLQCSLLPVFDPITTVLEILHHELRGPQLICGPCMLASPQQIFMLQSRDKSALGRGCHVIDRWSWKITTESPEWSSIQLLPTADE